MKLTLEAAHRNLIQYGVINSGRRAGHSPIAESETVETKSSGVVKRIFRTALIFWVVSALGMSGCGSVPTGTATLAPRPTAASVTPAPATATAAIAFTDTPPPSSPAVTAAATLRPVSTPGALSLTLWQSLDRVGAEGRVLTGLVNDYTRQNPGLAVDIQTIPDYQVYSRWQSGVAAGTGADLVLASNDTLGAWVRAGAVAPLDDQLVGRLEGVSAVAIDSVTVAGHVYGVPGSVQVVALYYRKSAIAAPPATTADLLALVKSGKRLVLNANNYDNFGFFGAFGGQLLDASGKCTADQGGFADAMQYLLDLKVAGASFQADMTQAPALMASGAADMIIDGPWALSELEQALGDEMGVAPMPAGPSGTARPLARVESFYINPRSAHVAAAVDLALAIYGAQGEAQFAAANDPPARTGVAVSDPRVQAFAVAAAAGFPRPLTKEFDNWWGPFGSMVTMVLNGTSTPAAGLRAACAALNQANGK